MSENVYEDALCHAVVGDHPVNVGHIKVYPNKEVESIEEMPPENVAHLFKVASFCATMLFEGLKAHGTNIIANNGSGKLCIDVIARANDDNLGFLWEPKQGDAAKVAAMASSIKSALIPEDPKTPSGPIERPEPTGADIPPDDPRVLHLRRDP